MMSRDPKGSERGPRGGTARAKKIKRSSSQLPRVPPSVNLLRDVIEIGSSESDVIVLDSLSSSDDDLPSFSYITPPHKGNAARATNARGPSHEYRRSPLASKSSSPRRISETPSPTVVGRPRTGLPTKSKPSSGSSAESAKVSATKKSSHGSGSGGSGRIRRSPSPPSRRRSLHERPRHKSESNARGRPSSSQRSAYHAPSSKTTEHSPLVLHSASSRSRQPAKERSGSKGSSCAGSSKSSGRNDTSSGSRDTTKSSSASDDCSRSGQGEGGALRDTSMFARIGHNFSDSDSSDSMSRFDLPDEPGLIPARSGAIRSPKSGHDLNISCRSDSMGGSSSRRNLPDEPGLIPSKTGAVRLPADEPGLIPSKSGAIRLPADEPGLIPSKSGAVRSPADSTSSSDFSDEPGRVPARRDDAAGGSVSRPDSPEKRGPIPSRSGAVRSSDHDPPDEPALIPSKSGTVRKLFANEDDKKTTAPNRTRHLSKNLPKSPVMLEPDVGETAGSQTGGATRKRHTSVVKLTAGGDSRQSDRDLSAREVRIGSSSGPSKEGESNKSHSSKAKGSRTDKVTETGSKSHQSKAVDGSTSHSCKLLGTGKSHQSKAVDGSTSHSCKLLGTGKSHSSKAAESSKSDSSKSAETSSKSRSCDVPETDRSQSSKATEKSLSSTAKETKTDKSHSSGADKSHSTKAHLSEADKSHSTKAHKPHSSGADKSHSSKADKSHSSKADKSHSSKGDKSHSNKADKSHLSKAGSKSKVTESHPSKTQSRKVSESSSKPHSNKATATAKPAGGGVENRKLSTSKSCQKPSPLGAASGAGKGSTESQSQLKGHSQHNTPAVQNTPRTVEAPPICLLSETSSAGKGHSDIRVNQTNSPALPTTPSLPVTSKGGPNPPTSAGRPGNKEPQLTSPPSELPVPAQPTSSGSGSITGITGTDSAVPLGGGSAAALHLSRGSTTTASATPSSKESGFRRSGPAKIGNVHISVLQGNAETNFLQQSSSRKIGVKPLKTSRKIKLKRSNPPSQDVLTNPAVTKGKGKKKQAVSKDKEAASSSGSRAEPPAKGGSDAGFWSITSRPPESTCLERIARDTVGSENLLSTDADPSSDTDALSIVSGTGSLVIPVRLGAKAGQQTKPNHKHVRKQTARKSTGGLCFKRWRFCYSSGHLSGYGTVPLKSCTVDVVRTKWSRKRAAVGDADRSSGPSVPQGMAKQRKYSERQMSSGEGWYIADSGQISGVKLKPLTTVNTVADAVIKPESMIPDGVITPKKRKQRKEAKTLSMVLESSDSEPDTDPTPAAKKPRTLSMVLESSDSEPDTDPTPAAKKPRTLSMVLESTTDPTPAAKKPRLTPPVTEHQDTISAPELSADELGETCARTRVHRLPSPRKRVRSEPSLASLKTSSAPDCQPSGSGLPAGSAHASTPAFSRSPVQLGAVWGDGSRQTVKKVLLKPSLVVATSLTPEVTRGKPRLVMTELGTGETRQVVATLQFPQPSGPETARLQLSRQSGPELQLSQRSGPETARLQLSQRSGPETARLQLSQWSGPETAQLQLSQPSGPETARLQLSQRSGPETARLQLSQRSGPETARLQLSQWSGPETAQLQLSQRSGPETARLQLSQPSGPETAQLQLSQWSGPETARLQLSQRSGPETARLQLSQPSGPETAQLQLSQPSGPETARLQLSRPSGPETAQPKDDHQANNALTKGTPSKDKFFLRLKPKNDRSTSEPPQLATPVPAPPPKKSSSVPPQLPPQSVASPTCTSPDPPKMSPRDEVYSLRLQETIAKLAGGGAEDDGWEFDGPQRQSSPMASPQSHFTVSFQLASLRNQLSPPTPTNEPRSRLPSVTTTRLGTYVSQGVQAEMGMVVNREVLESYLTVKTNEALYDLKEMLEATDRQVARITREKEELEKLVMEKQKIIQKLTQTSFKNKTGRVNKATSTEKATKSASTQTKRLRMPIVKRPLNRSQKPIKTRHMSWKSLAAESPNCLHHYSEEELQSLFTPPARDPLSPLSPSGSGEGNGIPGGDASEWLSREGSTSRCVPIRPQVRLIRAVRGGERLRRNTEPPIGSRRNGYAVAEWDSLGVNLRGEFLQLWQVLNLFKELPMEPLLLRRLARVIETLDHLLSHTPPPHDQDLALVSGGDPQQIRTVGFAAWLLGSKLQQLIINLEKLHRDDKNCLPTYFRAELVQTRTVVIETLKFITDGMRHATTFHDANGFAFRTTALGASSPSPDLSPSPAPSSLLQCNEEDLDLDFTSGSDLESSSSEEEEEEEEEEEVEGSSARTSILYKREAPPPSSCARVDSPWRARGAVYVPKTASNKTVSSIIGGSPGLSMSVATTEPGLLRRFRAIQELKAPASTSQASLSTTPSTNCSSSRNSTAALETAASSTSTTPDPSQSMDKTTKVALLERVARTITAKINQITANHCPVPISLSELHEMFPPSERINNNPVAPVTVARSTLSASGSSVSTATADVTKSSPVAGPSSVVHVNAHDLLALSATEESSTSQDSSTTTAATAASSAMQTTAVLSGTVCTSRVSPQQFTKIADILTPQQSDSIPKPAVASLASIIRPLPTVPPSSQLSRPIVTASLVRPVEASIQKLNFTATTRIQNFASPAPPNSMNLSTSTLTRDVSQQVLNSLSRSSTQIIPPIPGRAQLRQFLELARLPTGNSFNLRIPHPKPLPQGSHTAAVGAVQIPRQTVGMETGRRGTEVGTITAQAPSIASTIVGPLSRPLGPPATLQSSSGQLTTRQWTPENASITGAATAAKPHPQTGPAPRPHPLTGTGTDTRPLLSTQDSGPTPTSTGALVAHSLPTPRLQVVSTSQGIMIKWTFGEEHLHRQRHVDRYDLYAHAKYKPLPLPPISQWGRVGSVNPLPLPMAVTLTNFARGQCYVFTVRALFRGGGKSDYSEPKSVTL